MSETLGSDLWAVDDLDDALSLISGPLTLLQNAYRRLTTTRGALWYDPNYGTNILTFLADAGMSNETKAGIIRDEILKDERADDVLITILTAGEEIGFETEIRSVDGETYDLTVVLDGTNSRIIIDQNVAGD